jgi:elongation factor P
MADTSDFRNGLIMDLNGQYWTIQEFQHVKPGKGGAFVRTKIKNLLTGQVKENTFRAGEKIKEVRVERHQHQYLYKSGGLFCMMNKQTYEQIELSESMFEGQAEFLKENLDVDILMEGEKPLIVELPNFVELTVTGTEPGVRGDTATGATKPATMETGLVVQVPLFINEGDALRIDTRTGKYVTRV